MWMNLRMMIMLSALLLSAAFTGTCAQSTQEPPPPAMPVPTHVVTDRDSGKTIAAEQGDSLEVRLAEPDGTWRLSGVSGDARLHSEGESRATIGGVPTRVFRFRALQIGKAELTFVLQGTSDAPEARRVVTFRVTVS